MATYTKGISEQVSKNFESIEFDCNCKKYCNVTEIDPKLVEYLQKIRDHFKKPVHINSSYRCKKHNKAVNGESNSFHLQGRAADIHVDDVKPLKVAQYAESIGIRGIGHYDNFVHIDTRQNKKFWYSSVQKTRTTFGKYTDTTGSNIKAESDTTSSRHDRIRITNGIVNIRKGPGKEYALVGKLARSGEEYLIADVSGWKSIRLKNEVVWISDRYINTDGECTGSVVNIRCGPGTKYATTGKAIKGERFELIDPQNWHPVIIEGKVYWISGKYAKLI